MRRAFFFILAVLFANASFASIPRVSILDDAPAIDTPSAETRVWASDVLAPFERQAESELTRALRQGYEQASTTNASGLGRFLSVDPVLQVKRAMRSPQLWNRYSYALNNPLVFTDPTGETVYLVTYTTGNSEGDDEFRRAAMTRAADIKKQKGYDPKKDTVLVRGVATKGDFAQAVKDANALAPTFGRVGEINMFSHSGPRDGPIFQYGQKTQHQFASSDLGMNVNWEWWGSGRFYGCNTGVNFTESFAKAQGVTAWGYEGFASFSATQYSWSYPRSSGPLYLIHTSGWSNGGVLGMLGKWSGVNDRAVPMDPDEP